MTTTAPDTTLFPPEIAASKLKGPKKTKLREPNSAHGDAAKTIADPRSLVGAGATGASAVPAIIPVDEMATMLDVIRRAAADPAVDVEKMERLMAMHERLQMRRAEAGFNAAMSTCQSEMRPVSADATNPQTRSKYASYGALDNALRPIYTRHGFALSYDTGDGAPADHVRVLCHVTHGEYTRTYHADMPADGKGAKGGDVMTKTHAMGSAFTYGQRYLLKLIFNVAIGEFDDDGNGASGDRITAEQKAELIALMREVNADTGKFLAYLGVRALDELPETKFDGAKKALEAKRKKTAATASPTNDEPKGAKNSGAKGGSLLG